jgi:hypothetical protein
MLLDLQLLGKPDAKGNAVVVESRTHAGASVEEAVRTAKESSRARQCPAANALLPPRTCQPSQAIPTEAQRGASRGSKAIVERWRRGRELKLSRQPILEDRSSKGGGEVLAEIGRSYNVSLSSI